MTFRFQLLHRSPGYWTVLGIFAAANLVSWFRYTNATAAGNVLQASAGLPFPFLVSGADADSGRFFWTGLLLDIVIAWTLAAIVTWITLSIGSAKKH